MASNKPSRIGIPQRVIRTPSPTKSKLPVGGAQRAQPINKQAIPTLAPRERVHSKPLVEAPKRPEPAKTRAIPQQRRASKVIDQGGHGQSPSFPYSRETLDSRLELLHAHVLHRSSEKVQAEWKASAYEFYEKQFSELHKKSSGLDDKELEFLEQRNAAGILSWANQTEGATIEQQLQKASGILDEVWRLAAPDGKYSLAIQAFQHWLEAAKRVHRQRKRSRDNQARIEMIEGLGDGWKAEISALRATCLDAAHEILTLGEITPEGSDLQRCITLVSESLTNMLEELDLISLIEEYTVQDERTWVQGSINSIALGLKDGLSLV